MGRAVLSRSRIQRAPQQVFFARFVPGTDGLALLG